MLIGDTTSIDPSFSTNVNRFAEMTSEEFVEIMFTELANQDPLEPQDTSQLLNQIQTLRQIESDMELQTTLQGVADQSAQSASAFADLQLNLDSLFSKDRIASASNLIGREVSGSSEDSEYISGKVDAVRVSGEDVSLLLIGGESLALGNITRVW